MPDGHGPPAKCPAGSPTLIRVRGGIFVNYRVGDQETTAALLADTLARHFGPENVFFASRSIRPGEDFTHSIPAGLERSAVILVLIGSDWLTVSDERGGRRIDDPDDWVRREVREALALNLRVIPVLVEGKNKVRMPAADELPDDIARISRLQYIRMHYQRLNLERLVDELVNLVPELVTARLFVPGISLPERCSPSMLLRAEYQIVPFHGRDRELSDFESWCADGTPLAVRVITGPGGQGKTRLAGHLCAQYGERGWVAGLVTEAATPQDLAAVARIEAPILLVFDYAEGRIEQLTQAAAALVTRPSTAHAARLLLLTRASGEWQQELALHPDDQVVALFQAATERRLAGLARAVADRQAEFTRALYAFGGRLEVPDLAVSAPAELDCPDYDRVLDIHAAALSALLDAQVGTDPDDIDDGAASGEDAGSRAAPPARDAVGRVLHHERRYWRRTLPRYGLSPADTSQINGIVTVATLYGAPTAAVARRLLATIEAFAGVAAPQVDRYLRWAADIHPGPDTLNGLRPDRLGEDFVAAALRDAPDIALAPVAHLTDSQLERALMVLGRAGPRHEHLSTVVADLLATEPRRTVLAGMRVAPRLDRPALLAAALIDAVTARPDSDLVAQVVTNMPDQTLALADLAVLTTGLTLETAHRHAEINPAVTARLLLRHSHYLVRVGRREEAHADAEYATRLMREMTAQDEAHHLPDLAHALHLLAVTLDDLGRQEEGVVAVREAVTIRRRLAAADPDAYLPALAASLNTLSVDLNDLGLREESLASATEAVAVQRQLVVRHPERHLPGHAAALNNLALHLGDLGRVPESHAAAVEAVEANRRLADRYPDAYQDDLAKSLNNLMIRLDQLGRPAEALDAAQEALEIRRRLAELNPEATLPELASNLTNISVVLARLGRAQESLAAANEAVEICRELAGRYPDTHRGHLATALAGLSNRLAEARQLGDALTTATEVVEIRRGLAEVRPDKHRADLAMALGNVAARYGQLGDYQSGIVACQEAIGIYRERLAAHEDRYRPALAGLLHNYAAMLLVTWRREEAEATVREAIAIRRALDQSRPRPSRGDLLRALILLGRVLLALDRLSRATLALGEALVLATESQDERSVRLVLDALNAHQISPDVARLAYLGWSARRSGG